MATKSLSNPGIHAETLDGWSFIRLQVRNLVMLRASVWSCWLGGKYVDRKALESLHCEHCVIVKHPGNQLCALYWLLAVPRPIAIYSTVQVLNPANEFCLRGLSKNQYSTLLSIAKRRSLGGLLSPTIEKLRSLTLPRFRPQPKNNTKSSILSSIASS